MKPQHFLYKSDGLYCIPNMPEGYFYTNDPVGFRKAIERAKAEAVKCDESLYEYFYGQHERRVASCEPYSFKGKLGYRGMLIENEIYTINMEEEIEIYTKYVNPCVPEKRCLKGKTPLSDREDWCKRNCELAGMERFARIAEPKKQEESELTNDELKALSSIGVIAKNWYAVSYTKNSMPYAIFDSYEYAKAYRDKFSATSIVEPWPMVIKDLRKKN